MFRAFATFDVPEVGARHRSMEARAPGFRIGWLRGENVATDYGLLHRATPFAQFQSRAAITVILEGSGRFEERSRRAFLETGSLSISDQRNHGTEAFVGPTSSYFVFEWEPRELGVPAPSEFATTRLSARDVARLRELVPGLEGPTPARTTLEIMDVLRANGLPLARIDEGYLADRTTPEERALSAAIAKYLGRLEDFPAIEEVSAELGWSSRHVSRRIAELAKRHAFPWESWRASLHQARILAALRLASVGATTELIARKTGFRSPTALCHAFSKAGLPSPGALAKSARRDVLDRWGELIPLPAEPVAAE